jgi:thioesterase domain-containing protein
MRVTVMTERPIDLEHALELLQSTLHEEIPITRSFGLIIDTYDQERLTLKAPLAPNINDKGTVFAGTLNAVATLAGWSLLWLILREHNMRGKVVIQDSAIQYLKSVAGDFTASCRKPDQLDRLLMTIERKGIARVELAVEIREAGSTAVAFTGRYVIDRRI